MRLPTDPPKASKFCDLTAAARLAKLPGHWAGSAFRHHPCGIIRNGLVLCNEWNVNDYCWAGFLTVPEAGVIPGADAPTSWGANPHPTPREGELVIIYQSGNWRGRCGMWRDDLWRLLFDIESELEDVALKAEWDRQIDEIDSRREQIRRWDDLKSSYEAKKAS
jgi:hypothetical protein